VATSSRKADSEKYRDENDDESMSVEHLFTKGMPIQIQAKPTSRMHVITVTEDKKLKTSKHRRSWVSLDTASAQAAR
jgi:hypothetical protein